MAANREQPGGQSLEARTLALGSTLLGRGGLLPPIWNATWWDDHLMSGVLGDPAVKVQLFRFVDALPALTESKTLRRHLDEYLDEVPGPLPLPIRAFRALTPEGPLGDSLTATAARLGTRRMARRFIAGSTPEEAIAAALQLRRHRLTFTVDLLGEAVITEPEAEHYTSQCLELVEHLAPALADRPEIPQIDRDDLGPIPRMNLSVKLSSLTARFDPAAPEATMARVLPRLRRILEIARRTGSFVNLDMEQYDLRSLSTQIFRRILTEPHFRDWPDAGIVVQAYLKDSLADLEALHDWTRDRGTPITIRLVKGAYWDYEVLHARQLGWPVPVFERKWETDANYERCSRYILEHRETLRPAFASHNARSLGYALALAESLGVPPAALEVQLLHGMGQAIERTLVNQGRRVRVYTPYGALLPGMAYLVRRLLENTSNESFLKASARSDRPVAELLKDPEEIGSMWRRNRKENPQPAPAAATLPPFDNEPPIDFSHPDNRARMKQALDQVATQLGRYYPRHVTLSDGEGLPDPSHGHLDESRQIISRDPSHASRVVGFADRSTVEDVEAVVAEAREAASGWAATPPDQRAGILIRAAQIMRDRRFELAAWEVYECAKPWREADGDIAEAIDFCEYYAREMIRLAQPEARDVAGETNRMERIPRGVAVVIPPWNFPLAIPCGMTVAALVTGNTVILKPAEQSIVMAWHLTRILREAGLPPGVLHDLPGLGEEVGQALVNHPGIDLISFTGSRAVGLLINRQAAETPPEQDHVKRVIAEMGGKNAIIVDDDADLDEAVSGVLTSAFGYAGQKCSACSRVVVLEPVYDAFVARLVAAARALTVGPADDPDTVVSAVIDAEARARIEAAIEQARAEGRVVLEVDPGPLANEGHYVGPVILADVSPKARVAQEEIFGPVLAVIRAHNLDEAIRIVNGTRYALTGGVYSRSPAHIERVRDEVRVGNLYINRPITGALVERQPFGGFQLSGIGTKAGGPDYLREFLLTRVVTENTMRRGFAPELLDEPIAAGR